MLEKDLALNKFKASDIIDAELCNTFTKMALSFFNMFLSLTLPLPEKTILFLVNSFSKECSFKMSGIVGEIYSNA